MVCMRVKLGDTDNTQSWYCTSSSRWWWLPCYQPFPSPSSFLLWKPWGALPCQRSCYELFLCERRKAPREREEEPGHMLREFFRGFWRKTCRKAQVYELSGWERKAGFSKTKLSCGSKNAIIYLSLFLINFRLLGIYPWLGYCSESRPSGDSFLYISCF